PWRGARRKRAPGARPLQAQHGLEVSAATVRRWLHAIGGGWKRATLGATDAAPHRLERWARLRLQHAHGRAPAVMVFADARDSHRLPKVGAAWMPQGTQAERMTPGTHEQPSLAGARQRATGQGRYGPGPRKTPGLCRALLTLLAAAAPASDVTRLSVVVAHSCRHKAKAVAQWLATHPRLPLLWLPTYCPRANPMERGF